MKRKKLKIVACIFILLLAILAIRGKKETRTYTATNTKFLAAEYELTDTIKIRLKGRDENYKSNSITADKITVKVGGTTVTPTTKSISTTAVTGGIDAILTLSGFSTTGALSLVIASGTLTDNEGNTSDATTLSPGINIINSKAWTQDKTTVTNGDVTLEVGSAVSGYSANEVTSWYVLGAENGKLLLTTNNNVTTVTLSGQSGYVDGISTLNSTAANYQNTTYADSARSINVDDINRVTEYTPSTQTAHTYKNTGSCISYDGTDTSQTSFTYYTGSVWKTLSSGESVTITSTSYSYSGSSYVSGNAYSLLFDSGAYWLGSQFVDTFSRGYAYFGLRYVYGVGVGNGYLCSSSGNAHGFTDGLRPAVSLKSTVKVDSSGNLSI